MGKTLLFAGVALYLAACSSDEGTGNGRMPVTSGADSGVPAPAATQSCTPGLSCRGDVEVTRTCDGNTPIEVERDCTPLMQVCQLGMGCAACRPGSGRCQGNTSMICRPDGTGYDPSMECDPAQGALCQEATGQCQNLCAEAESSHSYIGCEYWPTPALNSQLDPEFQFAVAVANPQTVPAQVAITLGDSSISDVEVAPGEVRAINLPWIVALNGVS